MVLQILSNFIHSSYLPIHKTLSVQRRWLKFEFWCPYWRGIPSFWYPQILSCVQLKRLKSLNFGGPRLGVFSILKPPFFARFSLFLISTYSENLIHLARKV